VGVGGTGTVTKYDTSEREVAKESCDINFETYLIFSFGLVVKGYCFRRKILMLRLRGGGNVTNDVYL
jgi:hypothetical protein